MAPSPSRFSTFVLATGALSTAVGAACKVTSSSATEDRCFAAGKAVDCATCTPEMRCTYGWEEGVDGGSGESSNADGSDVTPGPSAQGLGDWMLCCKEAKTDLCFEPPTAACNYGWNLRVCNDGTCRYGVDAGCDDAGSDGAADAATDAGATEARCWKGGVAYAVGAKIPTPQGGGTCVCEQRNGFAWFVCDSTTGPSGCQ